LLEALEKLLGGEDAFRVLLVGSHQDESLELQRYRQEKGFRGPVVIVDEDDWAL